MTLDRPIRKLHGIRLPLKKFGNEGVTVCRADTDLWTARNFIFYAPWIRCQPYIVGILFGWMMAVQKLKRPNVVLLVHIVMSMTMMMRRRWWRRMMA